MHAYQKGPVIGEGTYGSVICATHKASGRQVAIKKVRLSSNGRDGVNMSVLRELKALRALAAPEHIVELLDTFSTKSSLVLVFEFMEWSLEDVIRDKSLNLSEADIKAYMRAMLQALAHVHSHHALHRDVKPDNLLIDSSGQLKLADFGLARFVDAAAASPSAAPDKLTPQVFGRWYRPPELLMGSNNYGYGVDMWAAGCVLAELLLRRPWFPGNCDMDQLDRIFKVLGVPTPETWPGYADLPHRIDFKPAPGQPLRQVFKQASPEALDLLGRLVAFDPERRISAADALRHPFFSTLPPPTPTAQLPRPASTRLNRLGLSRVPAVIPDMLMPHRLLQSQQQGFSTEGLAAASVADAGEAGEALLVQQQQQRLAQHSGTQQAAAAAGRSGLAGPAASQGAGTSRLLAFSDAPSFSGRFLLGQGLMPAEQPPPQQQPLQYAAGPSDAAADAQEVPWRGRLSFSGVVDEPSAQPAAAADGPAPGDENTVPHGMSAVAPNQQQQQVQQQQHLYRRPSPVGAQQQKTAAAGAGASSNHHAGGSSNSLRPPLHPNATPVHLRHNQQGPSTAAGNGDNGAAQQRQGSSGQHASAAALGAAGDAAAGLLGGRQRRGVSDLTAALSSAAATGVGAGVGSLAAAGLLNPLAPLLGMPRMQPQQQQQPSLLEQPGQPAVGSSTGLPAHTNTPAALVARGFAAAGQHVADYADADTACPMSLGTSARKRSRHVFEAAAGPGGPEQQAGHDGSDVAMLSSERRVVRGRRSSITSGCCSMEMDTLDGQQGLAEGTAGVQHCHLQQQQVTGVGAAAVVPGQLTAEDRSMSIVSDLASDCVPAGAASVQHPPPQLQQQQQHADAQRPQQQVGQQQQQQRWLQNLGDMPPPHAVAPKAARPWSGPSAVADPGSHVNGHHVQDNSGSGAGPASAGGDTCPMSLDRMAPPTALQQGPQHTQHAPPQQRQQQQPGPQHVAQQQQPSQPGHLGSQQEHEQQQQQPAGGSGDRLPGLEGLSSGDLITGGRPTADELRSMDPAELAELAKFWRPRLDSAERRYLRCKSMQLGEAFLQASQPDDCEDMPAFHHFPGVDSSPSGQGGLFDTPAKEPEGGQQHLQQQLQVLHELQQRQQQARSQQQQQQGRESVCSVVPPAAFLSPSDTPAGATGVGASAAGGAQHDAAAGGAAGSAAQARPPAAGHEPIVGHGPVEGQPGQDTTAQGQGVAAAAPALTAA